MRRLVISSLVCTTWALMASVQPAAAQLIGTFTWQTQPYCNRITLNVTQAGNAYLLDGFDDQCGAERLAPVIGTATLNPNGTVELGLAIVTTPGGEPTHMEAVVNLQTLGGTWSDSAGISGALVFNGASAGSPRPTGGVRLTRILNSIAPGPGLIGRRALGTPAAPTGVTTGSSLLFLGGLGHDGNGFSNAIRASINLVAAENWTTVAQGTRIDFTTTTNSPGAGTLIRMRIDHNGRVGIGTTSPAQRLHVAGNIRVGSGPLGCVEDGDGDVLGGVCESDARLKRDVVSFEPMLSKVAALRPVHFHWRAEEFPARAFGSQQSYGLVAQEVEQVLPELVTTNAEGFKAVNYSKLPLIALQAIKELKAKNDALEAQNAEFERRLVELEVRVKQ